MAKTVNEQPGGAPEDSNERRSLVRRQLNFYGDTLIAIQDARGVIWVHVMRLIESLGLSVSDQVEHIRSHEVMGEGLTSFRIQTSRGVQEPLFLRLGLVPFYLAQVQVNRVKPELREKLLRYQREAADVLYSAFLSEFGVIEPGMQQQKQGLTAAEQTYQQAQLLANLARQQLALEREVGDVLETVTGQQEALALQDERIGNIELTLGTSDLITESQATEIKEVIKHIGVLAGEKSGKTGKPKQDIVKQTIISTWQMFYREFGVRAYHRLPRSKFPQAMQYLREDVAQGIHGFKLDKGGN